MNNKSNLYSAYSKIVMSSKANKSKFWAHFKQGAVLINGGILLFGAVNLYKGNERFYEEIVMPSFRLMGAETAHKLGIQLAKYKIVPKPQKPDSPLLQTEVWGQRFPNPVGLAAGYDKHGEAVDGLMKMGFGFVEVGSITPEPQPGNAQPRVFRLMEDKAVINRYGFNSDGHELVYQRLAKRKEEQRENSYPPTFLGEQRNMLNVNLWSDVEEGSRIPRWIKVVNRRKGKRKETGVLGVNLGKNKTSPDAVNDYVKGVQKFGSLADYIVVNISSPNTPGLRDMQKQEILIELLDKVVDERNKLSVSPKPPLLVKIAPDLTESEKKDIAAVLLRPESGVDGLIVSNTTIARPDTLQSKHKEETGGLSGQPLKEKSLVALRDMYKLTQGRIPIVGVGGISCGQDAYDKVKAGASLIQLYTAMTFQGPPVIGKIKREMEELLSKDGYKNISEAVGVDVKTETVKADAKS